MISFSTLFAFTGSADRCRLKLSHSHLWELSHIRGEITTSLNLEKLGVKQNNSHYSKGIICWLSGLLHTVMPDHAPTSLVFCILKLGPQKKNHFVFPRLFRNSLPPTSSCLPPHFNQITIRLDDWTYSCNGSPSVQTY